MVYRLCNFVAFAIDYKHYGYVCSKCDDFSHHGDGVHTITVKFEIWKVSLLGQIGGLGADANATSDNWIFCPKSANSCVKAASNW